MGPAPQLVRGRAVFHRNRLKKKKKGKKGVNAATLFFCQEGESITIEKEKKKKGI